MFTRDLKTETTTAVLVPSANLSATNTGTGVDLRDYVGNVLVVLNIGTPTGTTPTNDVKIQDSTDNSTGWTDVTGAAFTQKTAAGVDTLSLDTRLARRYVRTVCTLGGTSPVFPTSITLTGYKQTV